MTMKNLVLSLVFLAAAPVFAQHQQVVVAKAEAPK